MYSPYQSMLEGTLKSCGVEVAAICSKIVQYITTSKFDARSKSLEYFHLLREIQLSWARDGEKMTLSSHYDLTEGTWATGGIEWVARPMKYLEYKRQFRALDKEVETLAAQLSENKINATTPFLLRFNVDNLPAFESLFVHYNAPERTVFLIQDKLSHEDATTTSSSDNLVKKITKVFSNQIPDTQNSTEIEDQEDDDDTDDEVDDDDELEDENNGDTLQKEGMRRIDLIYFFSFC